MDKRKIGVLLVVGLLAIVFVGGNPVWMEKLGLTGKPAEEQVKNLPGERKQLRVGQAQVMAEIRTDEVGRALGLSFREALGESEGMLFVFPQKELPTFWMKDMKFDLDMVWIADGKVAEITAGIEAPTETNPRIQTAAPKVSVDSILEVPAGWAERNGVKVGDEVTGG